MFYTKRDKTDLGHTSYKPPPSDPEKHVRLPNSFLLVPSAELDRLYID
jgi:hypothetical protein